MNAVVAVGGVLGVALAVLLFFFLPAVLFNGLMMLTGDGISGWRSVFEGLLRIVIFVLYIVVISKMPEIDRTFRYHGAEHKTIFCYENDLPLTVENVRKQKALPPALRLQLYDLNAFARHHHRFFHSVFQSVPAHIL